MCAKNVRWCRWGAERRVKRAQTRERGPPSAPAEIIYLTWFWLQTNIDGNNTLSRLADTESIVMITLELKNSVTIPMQKKNASPMDDKIIEAQKSREHFVRFCLAM